MSEDLMELNETGGGVAEIEPENAFNLYDLGEYRGEVETHWWMPDSKQPQKKIRLDLRIQAVKNSDRNIIQRKVNEVNMRGGQINFYQKQLDQLRPSREVDRLQEQLTQVSKFDFDGDEDKAEAKRQEIEQRIDVQMNAYKTAHAELTAKIEALLAAPTFYETLRTELFARVIEDHSIGIPIRGVLTKVDFTSPSPDHELPDAFASALQEFIWQVINQGNRRRRNSQSRKA